MHGFLAFTKKSCSFGAGKVHAFCAFTKKSCSVVIRRGAWNLWFFHDLCNLDMSQHGCGHIRQNMRVASPMFNACGRIRNI